MYYFIFKQQRDEDIHKEKCIHKWMQNRAFSVESLSIWNGLRLSSTFLVAQFYLYSRGWVVSKHSANIRKQNVGRISVASYILNWEAGHPQQSETSTYSNI